MEEILRFYNHLVMAMIYGGKDKKHSLRQIVFNILQVVEYEHKYKWTDPVTEEFKKEVIPWSEVVKRNNRYQARGMVRFAGVERWWTVEVREPEDFIKNYDAIVKIIAEKFLIDYKSKG